MHSAPPQGSATRSVPPALVLTTRVAPALKFMRARGRMAPSRRLYDDPHRRLKGGMPFSQPPCRSGALATHWPLTAACSMSNSTAFWLHASRAPTSSHSSWTPRCRLAWSRHRADGGGRECAAQRRGVDNVEGHLEGRRSRGGQVEVPPGSRMNVSVENLHLKEAVYTSIYAGSSGHHLRYIQTLSLHPHTHAPLPRARRARLATPSAAVRLRWSRSGRARRPPWLLRKSREAAAPSRRAARRRAPPV